MLLAQEFEAVAVGDLKPHPDNPRKGNLGVITGSIKAHGFFGACVVQRATGHILVGNHRWLAAREAGEAEVPVLWLDVDDEMAKRILLADNRTAEFATWDEAALHAMLAELSVTTKGLDGLAFTEADLAELADGQAEEQRSADLLEAQDVVIADPRHQVEDGQVYLLGRHVLVVAAVTSGWQAWAPYLHGDAVFCPHPSPYMPLSTLAEKVPLVMATSDHYLAGHVLDKWQAVKGEDAMLEAA